MNGGYVLYPAERSDRAKPTQKIEGTRISTPGDSAQKTPHENIILVDHVNNPSHNFWWCLWWRKRAFECVPYFLLEEDREREATV